MKTIGEKLALDIYYANVKSLKDNMTKNLTEESLDDLFVNLYYRQISEENLILIKYLIRYAKNNNIKFPDNAKYFELLIREGDENEFSIEILSILLEKKLINKNNLKNNLRLSTRYFKTEFFLLFSEYFDIFLIKKDLLNIIYQNSTIFEDYTQILEAIITTPNFSDKESITVILSLIQTRDLELLKVFLDNKPDFNYFVDNNLIFFEIIFQLSLNFSFHILSFPPIRHFFLERFYKFSKMEVLLLVKLDR